MPPKSKSAAAKAREEQDKYKTEIPEECYRWYTLLEELQLLL